MMLPQYVFDRLREPSTWRGIVLLITAAGAHLSQDQQEAIIAAGLAVAGLIGVFLPDPRRDQNITVNLHAEEEK